MRSRTLDDIRRTRLRNQRLAGAALARPEEVVRWMGAVQAQEYADAKWGLALRVRGGGDAAVERALTDGRILRTHILRPTWHFVVADDIRWMLALTGPFISRRMAPYNRRLALDAAVFRKSQAVFARTLRNGTCLTRQELKAALQRAGIDASGVQRLAHIVMQAELDAVICSGPRRGTQVTYALFDARVPPTRPRSREEALGELARRYFTSHGPAQLQDFLWWSGLPAVDARAGLEMIGATLQRDVVDGRTYWSATATPRPRRAAAAAHLLPIYDEYLIAYKDRRAAADTAPRRPPATVDPFSAPVIVNGQVVGAWRRRIARDRVQVRIMPFRRWSRAEVSAVADAARAYARALQVELQLL